eukprot:scaffold317409_cov27-Tisochrysis_lutea.AAC.2
MLQATHRLAASLCECGMLNVYSMWDLVSLYVMGCVRGGGSLADMASAMLQAMHRLAAYLFECRVLSVCCQWSVPLHGMGCIGGGQSLVKKEHLTAGHAPLFRSLCECGVLDVCCIRSHVSLCVRWGV